MLKERYVFERICGAFDSITDESGANVPWWFCFGTMLEYIADKTFKLNFDIDIGIFYPAQEDKIIKAMSDQGYAFKSKVVHDADKKALNIHFRPYDASLDGAPEIDVFCWYGVASGLLGHTYDTNGEGHAVLSKYLFKCVPDYVLRPGAGDITRVRRMNKNDPDFDYTLDKHGVFHYDIWEKNGPWKFRVPLFYGTLLDIWYPGWAFRDVRRGQSKSSDMFEGTSCNKLRRM
jgi:hypothetical protein